MADCELIDHQIAFSIATEEDRQVIYRKRHVVYAEELKQHATNTSLQLKDDLDDFNIYIVSKKQDTIVGFISITPAGSPKFSVDKYVSRSAFPFPFDNAVFEIRLLTVDKNYRNSSLALMLMYAAMRWIEINGGTTIVSICRSDIMAMYGKAGLKPLGLAIKSGEVKYELSTASLDDLKHFENDKKHLFASLREKVKWDLPFPFYSAACYHGGAFFKAVGEDLQALEKRNHIINADVLDAWFPPAPKVVDAVQEHLPWLLQTSPPTHADGLIDAIAEARKVDRNCVLPGAGSSNLIFAGLRFFLKPSSRVLIIDPCYGEYIHVLENVIGCVVTRFKLSKHNDFIIDSAALVKEISKGYDIVIIVNPNSPTGKYVSQTGMQQLLNNCEDTLFWIDETYIEYVGAENSLEQFAARRQNVVICKSMSKVYALSGARVAYMVANPVCINALKVYTPPWSISLPAQVAAIAAFKENDYYNGKYSETTLLREELANELKTLGINEIVEGVANFILFFLPGHYPTTKEFIEACSEQKLFLRDVSNMGTTLGKGAVRIAVKDRITNKKMVDIMRAVISVHAVANTTAAAVAAAR